MHNWRIYGQGAYYFTNTHLSISLQSGEANPILVASSGGQAPYCHSLLLKKILFRSLLSLNPINCTADSVSYQQ